MISMREVSGDVVTHDDIAEVTCDVVTTNIENDEDGAGEDANITHDDFGNGGGGDALTLAEEQIIETSEDHMDFFQNGYSDNKVGCVKVARGTLFSASKFLSL